MAAYPYAAKAPLIFRGAFLPALAASLLFFSGTACVAAQDRLPLTLESIFAGSEFDNRLPQNIQWHNDSKRFTFTRTSPDTGLLDIHEYDVAAGASRLIISGDALRYRNEPVGMTRCRWTADRRYLLLAGPVRTTWDGRNEAAYYIYEPGSMGNSGRWPETTRAYSMCNSRRTARGWVTCWTTIFTSRNWTI